MTKLGFQPRQSLGPLLHCLKGLDTQSSGHGQQGSPCHTSSSFILGDASEADLKFAVFTKAGSVRLKPPRGRCQ